MNDKHYIDQGSLTVYRAIVNYKLVNNGVSPSIPDLVELTGYQSTKPIQDRLNDLERRGLISRTTGTPRSIQVMGGKWSAPRVPAGITNRQTDVYRTVVKYAKGHDGNPPTLNDLGSALGLASDSTARFHVQALIEDGYLTKDGSNHRSIRVVGARWHIDIDSVPKDAKSLVSAAIAEDMVKQNGTH